MSSTSPWDAYSQHTGLPSTLDPYGHPFPTDMRTLAGGPAGMSSLTGDSVLGYPKSSDLSTAANLNLTSPYSAYGQSYPGVAELGFPGASLRPSSAAHSPAAADNLPGSPHGQYNSTPTTETQPSSPSFSTSSSLYTPSSSSVASFAQTFGSGSAAVDSSARGPHFSPFAQSYGYPMYGYNQMGGFPPTNSLDGVNRYMGGISSSQLMQSSAMGLYSNSQAGQMPFPYSASMGWGHSPISGFAPLKEGSDLMSQEELERYRYRQLSNPYFPGLPPGGPGARNFPPHPLQQGMMRTGPFLDDRVHSPTPKKPKKSTEETERAPTPAPRDPASFHSQRGIYLFTSSTEPGSPKYRADRYLLSEKDLCEKLSRVSLPGKIQYVYNPLEYAFDSHVKFVRRFCTGEKYILFVGMNPGPFGMSQNGVPFGECAIVKEWLQIDGEILKPVLEHPKRRVVGLECSRSEVTGGRFWQLFRTLCQTPEHFFRTSFVHNLCPFAFLTDGGKNVTPPQLTSSVLDQINALCNATLVEVVRLLKSKYVICIGKYALAQAQKALSADEFSHITLECLMHPSPINPAANKGWSDIAIKQLTEIGVIDIIRFGRVPYHPSQNQPPPQQQQQQQQAPPSLSHPPHVSSASMGHHPHHHNPYHNTSNKQSPGHYGGFQSPPVQQYGQANHHSGSTQSPAALSQRSQSSPGHAVRPQSSPAHSSCSQSPAQPGPPTNSSPSQHGNNTTTDPDSQKLVNKDGDARKQDVPHDNSGVLEKPQDNTAVPQLSANGMTNFPGESSGHENGLQSGRSEAGSQGSEVSKGSSPSMSYPSGGPVGSMGPPHMSSMGMGMTGSPSLQDASLSGSPHHNTHMGGPLNSHMAGAMGPMGSQMPSMSQAASMMGQMSSMAAYGQQMDMPSGYPGQSGMPANSYPPSMRPGSSEMPGYGGPMQPGMGSMMGGMQQHSSQMAMFNQHMAQQQMGLHPSLAAGSMYPDMGKEMSPYGAHYQDKPPECS